MRCGAEHVAVGHPFMEIFRGPHPHPHLVIRHPECGAGPLKQIRSWLWGVNRPDFCDLLTSLGQGGGPLQPPTGALEGQVELVALIAVT